MNRIKYLVYQEGKYFVSQCPNVEVPSFGETIDEAIRNLKEAVELYFEDEKEGLEYHSIGSTLIGEDVMNLGRL